MPLALGGFEKFHSQLVVNRLIFLNRLIDTFDSFVQIDIPYLIAGLILFGTVSDEIDFRLVFDHKEFLR